MYKQTIGLAQTIRMVNDIVERFGAEHVNMAVDGACVYYITESNGRLVASCIVGQVVADLGFLGALVEDAVGQVGACYLESKVWDLLEQHGVTFTENAKVFLRSAQDTQDRSRPWGEAVADAKRHIVKVDAERIDAEVESLRLRLRADSEVVSATLLTAF